MGAARARHGHAGGHAVHEGVHAGKDRLHHAQARERREERRQLVHQLEAEHDDLDVVGGSGDELDALGQRSELAPQRTVGDEDLHGLAQGPGIGASA